MSITPLRVETALFEVLFPNAKATWQTGGGATKADDGATGFMVKGKDPACHIIGQTHSRKDREIGDKNPLEDIKTNIVVDFKRAIRETAAEFSLNCDYYTVLVDGKTLGALTIDATIAHIAGVGDAPMEMGVVTTESDGSTGSIEGISSQSATQRQSAIFCKQYGMFFPLNAEHVLFLAVQSDYYSVPGYDTDDPTMIVLPEDHELRTASGNAIELLEGFIPRGVEVKTLVTK